MSLAASALSDAASPEAPLHAFWHGARMPEMAQACLESFIELGHPVTLHVYDAVDGVPAGIAIADAGAILPRDQLFVQRSENSIAPFTDRFRYELLARRPGIWIDCDLLCVRPIKLQDYIFGWASPGIVNGAVLHLPKQSQLLADLLAIGRTPGWLPPWYKGLRRLRYRLKAWRKPGFDYRQLGVGTIGPFALTHYVAARDLSGLIDPSRVDYPVPYEDVAAFVAEPARVRRYVTPETRSIHLWNSRLNRELAGRPPPPGSFVRHILDRTWRTALNS